MARISDQKGKAGEIAGGLALQAAGVEMVEKIGTPIKAVPVPGRRGIYHVIWGQKVSGDHMGILSGSGRRVLAETKTITDRDRLRWSDLRSHQPARLDENNAFGGVSLLVWVHHEIYILRWPVPGFGPRKSITLDYATHNTWDNRVKKLTSYFSKIVHQ